MGRLAVDLILVFHRYTVCRFFWTLLATVVDAEDEHRPDGQPRRHDESRSEGVYLFSTPFPSLCVHSLVTQHHTTNAVLYLKAAVASQLLHATSHRLSSKNGA